MLKQWLFKQCRAFGARLAVIGLPPPKPHPKPKPKPDTKRMLMEGRL